jgi:hypothetical protein
MLGWFDRACWETDTIARIGLCDLAVHDLAAIERHYANRTDIAGRNDRVFRSTFALPASLDPAAILDIQDVTAPPIPPGSHNSFPHGHANAVRWRRDRPLPRARPAAGNERT